MLNAVMQVSSRRSVVVELAIASGRVAGKFGHRPAIADGHGSRIANGASDAANHAFLTLQTVAYEALANKVADVRWRRIVAFALARFIAVGTYEIRAPRQEKDKRRHNAQHAKVLVELVASSPSVGPRQKAILAAASKLLADVSQDLNEPESNGRDFGPLRQEEAVQQFIRDLTEGFQVSVGRWPTLTDRSLNVPFVELATNAVIAARDMAGALDPNLASRLPPAPDVRELLRSFLCKKQRRRNPR